MTFAVKIKLFELGNKIFDLEVYTVNHNMSDNKKRLNTKDVFDI